MAEGGRRCALSIVSQFTGDEVNNVADAALKIGQRLGDGICHDVRDKGSNGKPRVRPRGILDLKIGLGFGVVALDLGARGFGFAYTVG